MSLARATIGWLAAATAVSAATANLNDFLGGIFDTRTVDVAVVGGGGSGAHAALRLQDAGKSFVVVEQLGQLGGHVNSYDDLVAGRTFDYGVNSYTNYTGVAEFFARIDVPVTAPTRLSLKTTYADFTSGAVVAHNLPANGTGALTVFHSLCEKYKSLLLPSYDAFPKTAYSIPDDLVMPFSQFVTKYGIEDAVPTIYEVTGLGLGDMMATPTMYVMATFGGPLSASLLGLTGSYIPATRRNQDIYDSIASILGSSVLYNSTVKVALRTPFGVSLVAQSSTTGKVTLVLARKLLMAIEPTTTNMAPFNLDDAEQAVFDKATWSTVNNGIVYHPSLPVNGSLTNLPASSAPDNYTDYATSPFVGRFDYMGEQKWRVLITGPQDHSTADAQEVANKALHALAAAGTIPATTSDLTIKAWSNHGALSMRTSGQNVKAGYITQQKALQNHLSTFWTGGAFSTQLSTTLWAYNDQYLLPLLYASLR